MGRLDKDTRGLLLFTNDGKLAYCLTHPKFGVERVYNVVLDKPLADSDRKRLEKGVYLEVRPTAPCTIRGVNQKRVTITVREGRKRQIRLMFAKLGYAVRSLERTRHASLSLGNLAPGDWYILSREEVRKLYQLLVSSLCDK